MSYGRRSSGAAVGVSLFGILVVAVVALIAAFVVWNWDSTDVDEYGLEYSAGPIDGRKFEGLTPPGSSLQFLGMLDYMVKLPANQRTYIVAENTNEGDIGGELITANDSEGVAVQFATSATFELEPDAKKLNTFALEICTKYDDCYDKDGTSNDGWGMMLNDYFRKSQEAALQSVTQQYTVDELMQQDRSEFQREVAEATTRKLNDNMGGQYFTDITFQIQRPIPPNAVQTKYNEQKAAELQTQVKAEEVEQAKQTKLAADELNAIENSEDYIALLEAEAKAKAVEKGNVEFWILPEGQGVDVTK